MRLKEFYNGLPIFLFLFAPIVWWFYFESPYRHFNRVLAKSGDNLSLSSIEVTLVPNGESIKLSDTESINYFENCLRNAVNEGHSTTRRRYQHMAQLNFNWLQYVTVVISPDLNNHGLLISFPSHGDAPLDPIHYWLPIDDKIPGKFLDFLNTIENAR